MLVKCPSDKILVVIDRNNNIIQTAHNQTVKIPFLKKYFYLDLTPLQISFSEKFLSRDKVNLAITGRIIISISVDYDAPEIAAKNFQKMSLLLIRDFGHNVVLKSISNCAVTYSIAKIQEHHDVFLNDIKTNIQDGLRKYGLRVIDDILIEVNNKI